MEKLGMTGTDLITGFKGTIVAFTYYITGCNQVCLTPKMGKDGKVEDSRWFDEQRVIIDHKAKIVQLDNRKTPGFGEQAPTI